MIVMQCLMESKNSELHAVAWSLLLLNWGFYLLNNGNQPLKKAINIQNHTNGHKPSNPEEWDLEKTADDYL